MAENDEFEIASLQIEKGSMIDGVALKEIRNFTDRKFLVAYVETKDPESDNMVSSLPSGETVLHAFLDIAAHVEEPEAVRLLARDWMRLTAGIAGVPAAGVRARLASVRPCGIGPLLVLGQAEDEPGRLGLGPRVQLREEVLAVVPAHALDGKVRTDVARGIRPRHLLPSGLGDFGPADEKCSPGDGRHSGDQLRNRRAREEEPAHFFSSGTR